VPLTVRDIAVWQALLSRIVEVSEDEGTATGGSNTTVIDTGKNWATDMWLNATVHVIHGGVEYVRLCSRNTADTLTIAALPAGVSVSAGDAYAIRRPVTVADITDRAARLLGVIYGSQGQQLLQRATTYDLLAQLRHAGVEIDPRQIRALTASDLITVQSITQWGGTALTGRDISQDLAKLDVALSSRAASSQLPSSLTTAGNLKLSVEEQAIALGIDVQARYGLKTTLDLAPTAVGTFWLPSTGSIDLSNFSASSWYVYAPTTTGMVINVYLNISHDGGTTWRRAQGYSIADANFARDVWNSIHCPLLLAEAKLEVVIGTAYPSELDLMCIRKA
jgi:hypothetical protein